MWTNQIQTSANWAGNNITQSKLLNISSINTNFISSGSIHSGSIDAYSISSFNIQTYNLKGYNNYLDYIENINIITNVITLDNQGLTATSGGLYLNGNLIGSPSTISSIADWSQFKAQTDVDMALSSIKNIKNLTATSGSINDLSGNNKIKYPFARLTDISANTIVSRNITTSSIYTNDMVSEQIYNQFEISTYSVYAELGVYTSLNSDIINNSNVFNGNLINCDTVNAKELFSRDIIASTVVTNYVGVTPDEAMNNGVIFADSNNTNGLLMFQYEPSSLLLASETNLDLLGRFSTTIQSLSSIYLTAPNIIAECSNFFVKGDFIAPYVSTNLIDSILINATVMATKALGVETILSNAGHTITSSIQTNNISTGSINCSNASFDTLTTNNINNSSNIHTATLGVSNDAIINNLTINGMTVNDGANYNTYISFATNNSEIHGAQYLYDINSVRNLQAEQLNVVGGWTGNNIETPYQNPSYITFGSSDGVVDQLYSSHAVTVINGVNGYVPGLDTNATTALLVRGDLEVDYGELTCYNGANFYPFAATANAISAYGDVNIIGVLSVEGDENIIGNVTVEGGFEVTGITTLAGDTNVGGLLTATGETNFLGGVTAEAGIGIIGAVGITGGDITIGGGNLFTNNSGTLLNNGLTVNGGAITFNDNLTVNGTLYASNINISNANISTMTIHDLKLSPNPPIYPPYPAWDPNKLYINGEGAYLSTFNYVCSTSNRNNAPMEPIPVWNEGQAYTDGNVVSYDDVNYICILSYSGGSSPPSVDYFHWYIDFGALWLFDSITVGSNLSRIEGDYQSYLSLGYVSTLNTFTNNLSSYTGSINSLSTMNILARDFATSTIDTYSLSTFNIQASNFTTSNINTNNIYVDNIYSLNSVSTIFNNNINMINNDIINIKTAYLSNLHGYADTDFITSYKNFNLNYNTISNVGNLYVRNIYGASNLDLSGDIVQMDGSINFGSDCNRARNFNCFYNTIFQDAVYVGQESNTAYSFNCFGDVNFGNASNSSKTFTNYYDINSSNILTNILSLSNIVLTAPNITYAATYNILQGNVAMDYLSALYNPSIWVKNDLDLSGNALLYVNYIQTSNIYTNATNSNASGYIENGINFLPFPGDDYFWMLVKPNMATTPVGNEGLQIVQRRTDDGSQEAIGRLYDDNIYTPWAHVTGDLLMMSNYSVVDASNVSVTNNNIYRGVVQPILQCGSDNTGTSGVTVTLPVEYPNSNYCIQLTYHDNPSGNKPLYHSSVTSSNFFVDGDNNADFDWLATWTP